MYKNKTISKKRGLASIPCVFCHSVPAQVELYKDRATFFHMYGPEPHPQVPGTNFDKGSVWPHYWSVVQQAHSYDKRVDMANRISAVIHRDEVSSQHLRITGKDI